MPLLLYGDTPALAMERQIDALAWTHTWDWLAIDLAICHVKDLQYKRTGVRA